MSATSAQPAVHFPNGTIMRIHTWWTILRISLEERLVYRGDFILATLVRFLPTVTQIFMWYAVFSARVNRPINGFSYDDTIAYFLLVMIGRAFSSMPGLASGISRDIREGTIKKYLIQPVDMIGFLLLQRIAHKLVYYMVATLPFALVFYLCRGFFVAGWPDPATVCAVLASLLMGFVLGFFLEAAIGLVAFWFLEVSSLLFIYMLFSFFLSGQMFPLSMLDQFVVSGTGLSWGDVVRAMPLQYLAFFPAAVFLGKIQGARLMWGLIIEFAWIVFFIVLCRIGFNRGVRRYSAFGG